MARTSVESDSSQKENAGKPVKSVSKSDKSRRSTRTGPLENGNRQRSAQADVGNEDSIAQNEEEDAEHTTVSGGVEGDVENNDEEEAEDDGGSPRATKRARVGRVNSEDEDADEDAQPKEEVVKRETLPRDVDGYVPGSIVRVKLHNFVTYDDVEFRPGPYLNMILGPNGTGKSSIACALCLGLNFPPSVLGRAMEINKFVKHGNENAFIEIELKGPKDESNLVIRREIKSVNKGSSFALNGQTVTAKEVTQRVAALNVQVTNLCAFLPQDRVAEFASMSPQQLLMQTQHAAGDKSLTSWHENLIKLGKETKQLAQQISAEVDERATLEQRNSLLERDVQLYKQRREIEKRVELLEAVLPYKQYQLRKDEYDKCKKLRADLHTQVKELAEKNRPAHEFKAQLEDEYKALEEEREEHKAAAKERFKLLSKKWDANEKYGREHEQLSDKLSNLKNNERRRKETMQRLTKSIHALEDNLSHPPEIEDMATLEAEIKKINDQNNQLRREHDDKEVAIKSFVDDSARQKTRIDRALNDIKNLDDVTHRKLDDLQRRDRETYDAVVWLRKNQNRFQMEVVEPPIISMSVPDQNYAGPVEACIRWNQLRSFVCQCREDYVLMNRLFNDTSEALGHKVSLDVWFRPKAPEQLLRPPLSNEEMLREGFDKYLLDCVQCPDGLLWFLQRDCNFHRIAVARNAGKVNLARAMELVSRTGQNLDGSGSFIAGTMMSTVTRSRYGKRLPQNNTRDIRPPQTLVHKPVDLERKKQLEQEIAEARTLMREAETEIQPISEALKDIEAKLNSLSTERKNVEERKREAREALLKIERMKIRLDQERHKLEQQEAAPSLDAERAKLRREIFKNAEKRAAVVKDLQTIIAAVIEDQTAATHSGLQWLQKGANKRALEELVKQNDKEYERAREEFENASRAFEEVKQDCKAMVDVARKKIDALDDDVRKTFEKMEVDGEIISASVEDIETNLAEDRASLELNAQTNPGVIEQYERRQQEIENLTNRIESKEKNKHKLDIKMQATRNRWLPALRALVKEIGDKFSKAFDRVGCAGEVRLAEHEDYEKWAIDIMVKFRDHEKLQLLTGQRQSGGERALTTIMYLMSLTELARAPFSLVDEINQGMDSNYERAVHNSLVEVTCKPDSGQYFLITPKLLTDLRYHERMKVLCVNNGEWIPGGEERVDGSMMKMIDAYAAKRSAKAA